MAGPFCAMQLADLGADVIKVENPDGGDVARDSAPFLDGESSPFVRLNRNKRSLALDLKTPEGKELFRHCSRPKVLDHDIRALDELAEELLAFGCLEVKSERALVPIEANERR